MRKYFSLSIVVVALAGLAVLPSAQTATTQICRGTLILETITIVSDTDVDADWPIPDRWTYHIYSRQNEKLVATGVQYFRGDTGKVVEPNLVVSNRRVGNVGDPVTLELEQWSKEKDPQDGIYGIFPADQRNNQNPFEWERETPRTCIPGDERFTTAFDVPARPGDAPSEHDGFLEYGWLWRFTAE
jgi:hypothetical protein